MPRKFFTPDIPGGPRRRPIVEEFDEVLEDAEDAANLPSDLDMQAAENQRLREEIENQVKAEFEEREAKAKAKFDEEIRQAKNDIELAKALADRAKWEEELELRQREFANSQQAQIEDRAQREAENEFRRQQAGAEFSAGERRWQDEFDAAQATEETRQDMVLGQAIADVNLRQDQIEFAKQKAAQQQANINWGKKAAIIGGALHLGGVAARAGKKDIESITKSMVQGGATLGKSIKIQKGFVPSSPTSYYTAPKSSFGPPPSTYNVMTAGGATLSPRQPMSAAGRAIIAPARAGQLVVAPTRAGELLTQPSIKQQPAMISTNMYTGAGLEKMRMPMPSQEALSLPRGWTYEMGEVYQSLKALGSPLPRQIATEGIQSQTGMQRTEIRSGIDNLKKIDAVSESRVDGQQVLLITGKMRPLDKEPGSYKLKGTGKYVTRKRKKK